jgi:hypothetical protein
MQPVQLSLIPEPHLGPAAQPSQALAEQLPEQVFAEAIALLAGVIAKTATPEGLEASGER